MPNAKRAAVAALEALEPRLLLNASLGGSVWKLAGDDNPANPADEIVVELNPSDASELVVTINGQVAGTGDVGAVRRIKVKAGAGDDQVQILLPDAAIPVKIQGGDGDDELLGGGGRDKLIGGAGNDTLEGGGGNDKLKGGPGRDHLDGGAGVNVLIGGPDGDWIRGVPDLDRLRIRAHDLLLVGGEPEMPDGGSHLSQVASLDELAQQLADAAVERWEHVLGQARDAVGASDVLPPAVLFDPGGGADAAVSAALDYSETNVQEAGVDEADLVKTDGEYLYLLSEDGLTIADAWPADELAVLSETEVEGRPAGLYVHGDRVTVLSVSEYWDWPLEPLPLSADVSLWLPVYFDYQPEVHVTVLNVSDRSAPEVLEETTLDGRLLSSRAIGGDVHVVVGSDLPWVYPLLEVAGVGGVDVYEAEATFRERVAELVAEALPGYVTQAPGEAPQAGPLVRLPSVYVPELWEPERMLGVVTFDVTDDVTGPSNSTSVVGVGHTVYASTESLYVVASSWRVGITRNVGGPATSVYKFDLTDAAVPLAATGQVPGTVLNQFSMDEHDGRFRIATQTRTHGITAGNIFVLEEADGELETAGSLTGLAPTERIQSVRFFDDAAFVVTFLVIDPLFTVDLSDPVSPEVVGELEMPGFSSYLHPVGEDHLIGFGRNATEEGRLEGLQLSLFDVSDLSDPTLVDRYLFDDEGWSYSEAEYDHHAFAYFAEHGVLAVPVQQWTWPEFSGELHVFELDTAAGFTELGTVEHSSRVRRSLRIGEYLYAVSEDTVTVHSLTDPSDEVGELKL